MPVYGFFNSALTIDRNDSYVHPASALQLKKTVVIQHVVAAFRILCSHVGRLVFVDLMKLL